MIDVVSVKFKNRGKCYFFDPAGLVISSGDKLVVETSKGLELADCVRGRHSVADSAVVQPLRPVVRVATEDDLRIAKLNVQREKEAFDICQKKINEHGLDMKLVDVECNFEGTKTMFFFTSDGRVDFRELVKDLAGVFRNRIELRQIGVRDEAKMIGGIGICGRPYCCNQFLDDFQPVSTKMAKVQSLSLNPTKISGSCGRLMCCLRYEQDAYEDLIKKVPKQGSFVETKDGFGTAVQVNLLRQQVKVKLDSDNDDSLRLYKSNELCAVPGGRPKDGQTPISTFKYIPEPEDEEEEKEEPWTQFVQAEPHEAEKEKTEDGRRSSRRGRGKSRRAQQSKSHVELKAEAKPKAEHNPKQEPKPKAEQKNPSEEQPGGNPKRSGRGRSRAKHVEAKPAQPVKTETQKSRHKDVKEPREAQVREAAPADNTAKSNGEHKKSRRYSHRPRNKKPQGEGGHGSNKEA